MKKRKFDVFNFFYSIGAVIILIGVIAKFLEWQAQDALLLSGLIIEALVFAMSSIQYRQHEKEYNWERLFPELVDTDQSPSSLSGIHAKVEEISLRYHDGLVKYVDQFEALNNGILQGTDTYHDSIQQMSANLTNSVNAFSDLKGSISKLTDSFLELHAISADIRALQENLQSMSAISVISGNRLDVFQEQMDALNSSIFRFNMLSTGIITQFKQIGN